MLLLEITQIKLYSPMYLYTGSFFVTGMKKVCIIQTCILYSDNFWYQG